MALSGIQIYKVLPQTNCKECGVATCLAFAMKLAARQAELSACPYVSDEAKAMLDTAAAPPIRLITLGAGDRKLEVGNETVVYRHEKTFVHQPGLFLRLPASLSDADFAAGVDKVAGYTVERVGQMLRTDGVAIEGASADAFAARVKQAVDKGLAVILLASDPAVIEAGLAAAGNTKPLIYAGAGADSAALAPLAKKYSASLTVGAAGDLEALAAATEKAVAAGAEDLVLDPGMTGWADALALPAQLRRAAIKKNFKQLGYPIIAFPGSLSDSAEEEAMLASLLIGKYAGLIVLDRFDQAVVYSLLALRQNIYTDPQKPIQVSPGLYEIGEPEPGSPLLVTTNFSLTYFSVAGEVEGSGRKAWLLVADSEGLSVLTAWAAGKFDAEAIAKAVKTTGVAEKINHKSIVLPGAVAGLSGELEEELPGWKVLVGPRESIGIPSYLKLLASQ